MELRRSTLHLLVVALCKFGTAFRQDIQERQSLEVEAQDHSITATARDVPQAAFNLVHRIAPRQCQLMYFAEFIEEHGKEHGRTFFSAALETAFGNTPEAAKSRIEEDDSIDAKEWPACKPGSLVMDCARTLKPAMWLQQTWALDDRLEMHKNAWYCPWCSTKDENFDTTNVTARSKLYAGAIAATDFSVEASASLCEKEVSKTYDKMQLRECMVVRASQVFSDLAKQEKLMELLTGWWSFKDSDTRRKLMLGNASYVKQAGLWVQDIFGAKSGATWLSKYHSFKRAMSTMGFNYNQEKKHCIPMVSKAQETQLLDRIEREVSSACDKDKGCSEKNGTYCPEGTACDCQRPFTPQRALTVFNSVFWVISPLTVATVASGVALATGGVGAVPSAIWTAGWFPDYIPAVIAMAAASRKWTPECMCFDKECTHDADLGICVLKRNSRMRDSSNPYSWLPANGQKCVRKVGSDEACEIQTCSETDASQIRGFGLFGRVGYEDVDLYNCANVEGTVGSQLTFLESLPNGEGAMVENTVKVRTEIYDRFELPSAPPSSA